MGTLSTILHPDFGTIRTEIVNAKPFFCATDVCKALGYTNDSKAINDHCRGAGVTKRYLGVLTGKKADGSMAKQQVAMTFIDEGNLYRLILKSRLPAAAKFEAWVCDEVLPAIRRTGTYSQYTYRKGNNANLIADYEKIFMRAVVKIDSARLRKSMVSTHDFFIAQLNLPSLP